MRVPPPTSTSPLNSQTAPLSSSTLDPILTVPSLAAPALQTYPHVAPVAPSLGLGWRGGARLQGRRVRWYLGLQGLMRLEMVLLWQRGVALILMREKRQVYLFSLWVSLGMESSNTTQTFHRAPVRLLNLRQVTWVAWMLHNIQLKRGKSKRSTVKKLTFLFLIWYFQPNFHCVILNR